MTNDEQPGVKVKITGGHDRNGRSETVPGCDTITVQDGHLIVSRKVTDVRAVYAPGTWISAGRVGAE